MITYKETGRGSLYVVYLPFAYIHTYIHTYIHIHNEGDLSLMHCNRLKFNIGDVDIVGHGKVVSYIVEYKGVSGLVMVEAAYANAVLFTGVDFSIIAMFKEDWFLYPVAYHVFEQRGCPYLKELSRVNDHKDICYLDCDDYIKLLLWFIQEGSDFNFEFKLVVDETPEFSRKLGYGLFEEVFKKD